MYRSEYEIRQDRIRDYLAGRASPQGPPWLELLVGRPRQLASEDRVRPDAQIALARNFASLAHIPVDYRLAQRSDYSFRSGDNPDALYGEDVYACVIDEASRFKEDAWFAIRSTLTATRGKIRIIGNVKGKSNWFYHLARRAEEGKHPELGYHKLTAYDAVAAGVLAADEIAEAR